MAASLVSELLRCALAESPDPTSELVRVLARTERLSADALLGDQLCHILALLRHAHRNVPFYRGYAGASVLAELARLSEGSLTLERFRALPVLERATVQEHAQALRSERVPPGHRIVGRATTSGSTGRPLVSERSLACARIANALQRRFHAWHRRDPHQKAAFITHVLEKGKAEPPHGLRGGPWLPPEGRGEGVLLTIRATVDEQLDWLERERPVYLATFPSNALALLRRARERSIDLPGLVEITLSSEPVPDELRELARSVCGATVTATYSANEVGAIALQAPEGQHYLVQAESLLVEVLDEHDRPCAPGAVGRVVVTTLHDPGRPLLRYAVGDYAEVGGPSPCGRGLPVLSRIMGRERNMLRLANGELIWPFFSLGPLVELKKLEQWQILQPEPGKLIVRVVARAPLSESEREVVRSVVVEYLRGELAVEIMETTHIDRTPGGKFEEFVSDPERVARILAGNGASAS
jgi:phenylacetate-CoA ligase